MIFFLSRILPDKKNKTELLWEPTRKSEAEGKGEERKRLRKRQAIERKIE